MYTTSNPSAKYVEDVANVFKPNEDGNFKEIIKAILLHPEARNCEISDDYTFGKLREPLVRMTNLLKAFPLSPNQYDDYFNYLRCNMSRTGQAPLQAPSVFNFFLPDYQPQGPIGQNYLAAPEFQVLNATRAIGSINDIDTRAVQRIYMDDECGFEDFFDVFKYTEDPSAYQMDYSDLDQYADNAAGLIDHLDILLANGLLSNATKDILIDAVNKMESSDDRIKMAIYGILVSPDYVIIK